MPPVGSPDPNRASARGNPPRPEGGRGSVAGVVPDFCPAVLGAGGYSTSRRAMISRMISEVPATIVPGRASR
jgi:hypothetical protein